MTFKEFIEQEGVERVALVCGATKRAVQGWRYRARRPKPDAALKIIALSKGALTWADIYPPKAP